MAHRSVLDRGLVTLLALLLLGASAAAQPEQDAARSARTALDRADLKGAQKIVDDALARFGSRDSEAVWALRVMAGEAWIGRGQTGEAQKALAFELPAKYRRSETAVRHLIMRSFAAMMAGDSASAMERIEAARVLAGEHQPAALADVYVIMANVQTDVKRGEEHAREAIRVARQHRRKSAEAKGLASLALMLNHQQRFAESIQWGEQALASARALRLEKSVQQIGGNLGWSYFEIGDHETAAELFIAAEATATRIGADGDRVEWLIQLGNIRYQQRDWVGADRYNRQAVAIGTPIRKRGVGFALANLARISLETGRFDDAGRFNAQALEWKRGIGDDEAELSSNIVEARIAVASRDLARGQKLLEDVRRDTKRIVTRMDAESRLAQLYARTNRTDRATVHFQRALQTAREARKEVKDRDLRFSFFNSAADLFDAYVDFLVATNRAEEALAVTETSRAETLEEGLSARSTPGPLDARAIARQNNATVLCYWLGRDRSYLWVVTAQKVALHRLPPDTTIEKAVETYRRDLLGPRGTLQASGARGEELYRMLVAPAAVAKGSRVIIVADGQLHALNFETLVAPTPRRYWIEDVVLTNAGSLQLLARKSIKPKADPSMLLVGNPRTADPSFPPLPHAAKEMELIRRRFQRATVLSGAKATPAAYEAASPGKFDFVHFVAHGVATRKRPLDSAVILARENPSKSYKLLAREVVATPLSARLVTISSCHGAGTRTYAGEGVVGLAWAFLRAGADQVVAALWEVSDATTPRLMDRMYEGIAAGRDPAVALRDAKLLLIRSQGVERKPLYWAPFVLYVGT